MDIYRYIDLLGHVHLFHNFTKKELLQLFHDNTCQVKEYKKNTVIYFENEKCYTVDLILQGSVLVQKIDAKGSVLTISNFSPGEILGANLLFAHHNTYPMTIMAKSSCILLHIKKELILKMCQQYEGFLLGFLQCISDRTLVLTDKLKSVTLKTIRQSIIGFLAYEYHYQKSPIIQLGMSKKDLAERLGIQRPSLSRELNKMRKDGLIEYDAKTITLKSLSMITNIEE